MLSRRSRERHTTSSHVVSRTQAPERPEVRCSGFRVRPTILGSDCRSGLGPPVRWSCGHSTHTASASGSSLRSRSGLRDDMMASCLTGQASDPATSTRSHPTSWRRRLARSPSARTRTRILRRSSLAAAAGSRAGRRVRPGCLPRGGDRSPGRLLRRGGLRRHEPVVTGFPPAAGLVLHRRSLAPCFLSKLTHSKLDGSGSV